MIKNNWSDSSVCCAHNLPKLTSMLPGRRDTSLRWSKRLSWRYVTTCEPTKYNQRWIRDLSCDSSAGAITTNPASRTCGVLSTEVPGLAGLDDSASRVSAMGTPKTEQQW